jgi:hypothetical protein
LFALAIAGAHNVRNCPLSERQSAFARPGVAAALVVGTGE